MMGLMLYVTSYITFYNTPYITPYITSYITSYIIMDNLKLTLFSKEGIFSDTPPLAVSEKQDG